MKSIQDRSTTEPWGIRKTNFGRQLLQTLYEGRLFKTWLRDKPEGWELVSGYWSPFYIQMRNLPSHPTLFAMVSKALSELIQNEAPKVNRLIGLASTGVPIAAAAAMVMGMPMGYTRKLPGVRNISDLELPSSDYGAHVLVEGDLADGDHLAIVDDVAVRFTSKELAIRQIALEVERRGLSDVKIDSVAVLIDREQGATAAAKSYGVSVISLLRLRSEGFEWLKEIALNREFEVIYEYLKNQEHFQDPAVQEELRREAVSCIASETAKEK